ncbi:hypothetical protein P9265_18580 [Schinkia azotoformans]|uniref:hypothetical protein n=1 Tax=Schinkia azotoformans TaxID=1454 RepID=UPI002E2469B3|nr:hypothetical protein [Schinkia azotoformans]
MIEMKDKDLVCQFIVLDNTLKLLTKELEAVENSKIKIKNPHINFILLKIDNAHKELRNLHKQLKCRGIHIQEMKRDELNVEYPFTCRGYFDIQIMKKNVLKNNVIIKIIELYKLGY